MSICRSNFHINIWYFLRTRSHDRTGCPVLRIPLWQPSKTRFSSFIIHFCLKIHTDSSPLIDSGYNRTSCCGFYRNLAKCCKCCESCKVYGILAAFTEAVLRMLYCCCWPAYVHSICLCILQTPTDDNSLFNTHIHSRRC